MTEFADFAPYVERHPRLKVAITPILPQDVEACALLGAAREGAGVKRRRGSFEQLLDDPTRRVVVAHLEGEVVGYGKASLLRMESATNAPAGWYLTGMVVGPRNRRRGVGDALTRARVAGPEREGIEEIWYFANAQNLASLRLHEEVGFREVTRDFAVPGVTFAGEVGVLSRYTVAVPHT